MHQMLTGNNRFRSGHANLCKYSETTLYFHQWERTDWRGRRIRRDSKISGPRGCWYRQKEGEIFCMIGLRSWRCCQIFDDRNAKIGGGSWRGVIGGARGAAFRVSRSVARSHGSTVRIRRSCELRLFEKEKKERTGVFKFPSPRESQQRFFDLKKCQVSLTVLCLCYWYTEHSLTHTYTYTYSHATSTHTKLDTYTHTYIHTYICIYT